MKSVRLVGAILVLGLLLLVTGSLTEASRLDDRQLTPGMSGGEVKQLQIYLAEAGFDPGPIDGQYGKMTKTAVMLFQQANQLPVDGIATSATLAVLIDLSGETARGHEIPTRYKNVLKMKASAYTAASGNLTYSGTVVRRGVVAVDPRVIPLGTRLYVDGYGYAVAEDIGSAIKGLKIDIALPSVSACYQWGVRNVTVYILE